MSVITVENLLEQIETLPVAERQQLITKLNHDLNGGDLNGATPQHKNGAVQFNAKPKSDFKYLKPLPMPNYALCERWIAAHEHEYGGEWIALDGDRLIAHDKNGAVVFAAARADGCERPLVYFVIPADAPPFI